MTRYRKRPVEVEARRLTKDTFDDIRLWLAEAEPGQSSYQAFDGSGLVLPTLEGDMIAAWGDYVIQGVEGEFYPCRASIFRETYEAVEEEL